MEALFGNLGGSWKSHKDRTEKGRFLHGKEGQGRFKAFSIGRVVIWKVVYKKENSFYEYQIECHSDDPERCTVTGEIESTQQATGVEICISELDKKSAELSDTGQRKLLSILALYLIKYPSIIIFINGEKLTIDELIRRRKIINLNDIEHQKINYSVELDILEWTDANKKELLFCGEKGFVLDQYSNSLKVSTDLSFSAFIRSSLVDKLNMDNTLALGDLDPSLKPVIDNAILELKNYFLNRAVEESQLEIEKWKQEDIYPYKDEAFTPVEDAERKIFDIVAVNIKRNLPSFDKNDKQGKKFQLRMLRQAIERSPKELQVIIEEVLQLPSDKRTELAELLRETKLASIISASTIVSDRLKFISGLETLLFDMESKKHFKERTQLHKILAENTWIFGDEFSLSVSDRSLTEVLRKHIKGIGTDIIIDEPVIRLDGSVGIIDLMLSKSIPCNHVEELEHLVVELKAPKIRIGQTEINQIENYAMAVSEDERFRSINTRWSFWVISNDIDNYAKNRLKNFSNGIVYDVEGVTIWIKTWSEVIRENKHRLEFIRDQLNYNMSREDGLDYLKTKYAEFTKGIITTMD